MIDLGVEVDEWLLKSSVDQLGQCPRREVGVDAFHHRKVLGTGDLLKQVEILCVGAALGDDMSLEYVLKTHWRGHAEDELLALHYQMREER